MPTKDDEIIRLLFGRDEGGLKALSKEYTAYCSKIAFNILGVREDAEECVNDAFLTAWNTIPPNSPEKLSAYLGKLVRNNAINKLERNRALKRGNGACEAVIDELEEVIPSKSSVETSFEAKELMEEIGSFLHSLPQKKRKLFVLRYFCCDSVRDIAAKEGISENSVSVTLNRIRKKLKTHLEKRGY
ncbi:MAG: sigma-70 family RNA polymerase sigma factor [Ruminococcaceae bacterium]|nr:sigma-70 family RNA polymerase sigma factor [Oscillospiraceae bacterium]